MKIPNYILFLILGIAFIGIVYFVNFKKNDSNGAEINTVQNIQSEDITLEELENNLLGGYLDSATGAYWLAKQEDQVIPLIEEMLSKLPEYMNDHQNGVRNIGTFPYNAIYGVAHINSPQSEYFLEKCLTEEVSPDCSLGLEAFKFRKDVGELDGTPSVSRIEAPIYSKAALSSDIVGNIEPGSKVIILETAENPDEVGPRGGNNNYFKIRLFDEDLEGFVQMNPDSIFQFI